MPDTEKPLGPEFECLMSQKTPISPSQPQVRFNFDNGWSASIVFRTGDDGNAIMARLAACPTGRWGDGITELGESEAFANEAAAYLAEIAARPPVEPAADEGAKP